jgi:hypothetical protein
MPKRLPDDDATGQWIIRDVPVDVMARMRVAAALQRTTIKQLILDLAVEYLRGLERQHPPTRGSWPIEINPLWRPVARARSEGRTRKPRRRPSKE